MNRDHERSNDGQERQRQQPAFYDFSGWLAHNPETTQPYFDLMTKAGRLQFVEAVAKIYLPEAQVLVDREIAQGSGNGYVIRFSSADRAFYLKIRNVTRFGQNLQLEDGELRAMRQAQLFTDFIARHHHPQVEESEFLFPLVGFFASPDGQFVGHIMPECTQGSLDDRYIAIKLRHQGQENDSMLPPLSWPEIGSLVRRYLSTLVFYEGHGVRHRDQKCENVYIDAQGQAYLADADYMSFDDEPLTLGKMDALTNVFFMAPETMESQTQEQPIATQQSEQYSAALVLYRALSRGRYPFLWQKGWTESDFQALFAQQNVGGHQESINHIVAKKTGYYHPLVDIFFEPAQTNNDSVPTPLFSAMQAIDLVLAQALALRPEDRFATNLAFAKALLKPVHQLIQVIEQETKGDLVDPLWADPGKSIGRGLPRYQEQPVAETIKERKATILLLRKVIKMLKK